MKTSKHGIKLIETREGSRLKVYRDSKGLPTVGVGHLIVPEDGLKVGQVITQEQCDAFLAKDLKECEDAVNAVGVPLKQWQFDALVSFIFNIGTGKGGFKTSTCRRKLQAGDYEGAAKAMLLYKKPPEIIGRRQTEVNQFLHPDHAYTSSAAVTPPPTEQDGALPVAGGPSPDQLPPGDVAGSQEQPPTSIEQTTVETPEGISTATTTTTNVSGTVTVTPAKASIKTQIIAAGTALLGAYKFAKENFDDLLTKATGAIDAHFIANMLAGAGLIAAGIWLYNYSQQRAHEKTVELIKTAADPALNNVEMKA